MDVHSVQDYEKTSFLKQYLAKSPMKLFAGRILLISPHCPFSRKTLIKTVLLLDPDNACNSRN